MMWMWSESNKIYDEFKMSYKLKIVDYDLSVDNKDGSHTIHKSMFASSSNAMELRVLEKTNSTEYAGVSVYVNNAPNTNIPVIPETEYTYTVENSMLNTGWIELNLLAFDGTFTFTSGNAEVMSQRAWGTNNPTTHGLYRINQGKATDATTAPGKVYFDDISVSKLIYVTDTLENKAASATVEQGDSVKQTTTVDLTMSDGTTKTFTVNFDADTATAGTGKTATGTIDGFDGNIPVTYTVVEVTEPIINTYVGADVTLADGTKADTTAFGRKYYKVTTDDGIINYTVNIGRYDVKVSDDMQSHKVATEPNKNIATIEAVNGDGLKLSVYNDTTATNYSATIDTEDDNQWIKLDKKTPNKHLSWKVVDSFSGDGRVSMKIKNQGSGDDTGAYIRIYDTKGVQMTNTFTPRFYDNEIRLFVRNDTGLNNQILNPANELLWYKADWKVAKTTSDGVMTTEPYTLTFDFHTDTKTYDVMINGVENKYYKGLKFGMNSANGNVGSIVIEMENNKAISWFDDLTVYQYNCFTGSLPANVDLTIGQGEAAPQSVKIPLALSNGSVMNADATINVDASSIAQNISAQATLAGFDEKVNATVDVSNYYIDTIGYRKGNEFTTAPLPSGEISELTIVSKSGRNQEEKAVVAWLDSHNNIKAVKSVTIPALAKGAKATVEVGMALPAVVEGGKLKIFTLDSLSTLTPIDFTKEVPYAAQNAPTVYTVGDSTMCNYPIQANGQWPRTGVGMVLGNYFDGVTVNNNYASSGEWTESFIEEGWWEGIKNNLKVGDYVIISLGHNDQGACSKKYSLAECVYKKNLKKMIDDAQAACANVILYSPIRRQHEADADTYPDPFGKVDETMYKKHSHYADMAELASEEDVSYIDMTAISAEMLAGKTTEEQQKYYVRDLYNSYVKNKVNAYTSHENWAENSYFKATIYEPLKADNDAMADTSHYNVFGAKTYARRIADEIKALDIILSDYVNDVAVGAYPALD